MQIDLTILSKFITESNAIEGIPPYIMEKELTAYMTFLAGPVNLTSLQHFVSVVEPKANLRNQNGMNVMVGDYYAPDGGGHIERMTIELLEALESYTPYEFLCEYLHLHPFTDCNGRSGRVIWLWHMMHYGKTVWNFGAIRHYGFLRTWFYQSLENFDQSKLGGI